tara:strand:- start:1861 stop:2085 length:225 start_codon:yes stop_codon:yes gene_type:complete
MVNPRKRRARLRVRRQKMAENWGINKDAPAAAPEKKIAPAAPEKKAAPAAPEKKAAPATPKRETKDAKAKPKGE